MALQEAWHIRSRARQCVVTGRTFRDGESIITGIFPDPESAGYLRKDFSQEAWNQRNGESETVFSYWQTVYQPALVQEADQVKVTKQGAEELLRALILEDEEHTENTRYILAIMLERHKLLRETDSQLLATGILRIYEHRKTGEVFIIKDPNISLDEVENIQAEVIALLSPSSNEPT